jgi:diguanylate cyclase (GGDEF)-like protein/PAS domain S-box-containing protein
MVPFSFVSQQPSVSIDKNAEEAFVVCDVQGNTAAWNSCAEELFGWSAQEALGKPLASLIVSEQYWTAMECSLEQFSMTGRHDCLNKRMEAVALHKDRYSIPIEFTVVPMRLKEQVYFIASIKDCRGNRKDGDEEEVEHQRILALSRDAIVTTTLDGEIRFWNRGAEQMFGYSAQEAIGRNNHELLSARYPSQLKQIEQNLLAEGYWEGEVTYTARDGAHLTALSRWVLGQNSEDRPAHILISSTDVSLWKRVLELSFLPKASQQRFDSWFGLHPNGAFAFSPSGRLIAANAALSGLTGYSNAELLHISLPTIVAPENLARIRFHFRKAMRGIPQTYDFTCIRKDETRFDASITLLPHMVDNKINGLHGIVEDISHRKHNERRVLYLATHDPLTGLPNRNLLNDRMQHAIEQARRLHSQVGILFMDLNRFKVINDSLGHDKGDVLLCTIADRLKSAVREVDTVARLGGDEFVVLLENITASSHVMAVAQNLLKLVSQPINLDGNVLCISTSIGASIYPKDGGDTATLLKNADLAMYDAKDSASGMFRLYAPEMNTKAVGRLARESSLRHAIEHGELVLYYQPRLDIVKNAIVGMEALVRWDHPENGLIFPINFISLAEEIGMIDALGEWVLITACRQLKEWQEVGLGTLKMSVNVSAVQLKSEHICDKIAHALAVTGLDPSFLELEITESSLMQNLDASYEKLREIQKLGVSLSIDDFGTGYSSLSYLKRLPINTLKIDKSFVRDVSESHDDAAIVTATIAMAHSMNLRVVAEGVTSYDQMRFLESCCCDEMQGFLLCQPLPAHEAESFFRTCKLRGIYYSWVH